MCDYACGCMGVTGRQVEKEATARARRRLAQVRNRSNRENQAFFLRGEGRGALIESSHCALGVTRACTHAGMHMRMARACVYVMYVAHVSLRRMGR